MSVGVPGEICRDGELHLNQVSLWCERCENHPYCSAATTGNVQPPDGQTIASIGASASRNALLKLSRTSLAASYWTR